MIKSIKKKYLRKKKTKKIKGRYISKKQKGGTKKRKYISKKYKKRKYISKKKKGGSNKSELESKIAAAAEGASFGAVKAVAGCNSDTSNPGSSATSRSNKKSVAFELSPEKISELLEKFKVYDNVNDDSLHQVIQKGYEDINEKIFESIDRSQICKIADGYDMGNVAKKFKGGLAKILPNLKEMFQREFFNNPNPVDPNCIISGILSKEIIQELLYIIYNNFGILKEDNLNDQVFTITKSNWLGTQKKRDRTLQLDVAITKYSNKKNITNNIKKILEVIYDTEHKVVRDKIVGKAIEIIKSESFDKNKLCDDINELDLKLSDDLITNFFGDDMKECKSSMVTTLTTTAQKITDWFKGLFPGDNTNAGEKLNTLTLALNELKTSLETHKKLLEPAPTASASADNDPAPDDTEIKAQINSKLEKILGLIKNPNEQSKEQTEEKPEEQQEEQEQPTEITDLISFIEKLQKDYSTEGTETTELTVDILITKITDLDTLIDVITNENEA